LVIFTVLPATVMEEALDAVHVESARLREAIKYLDGRLYIGVYENTSKSAKLAATVRMCIRAHITDTHWEPKSPPAAGQTISFNSAVAAVCAEKCINNSTSIINWDGVECTTLAPPFVFHSPNKMVIGAWFTRSEVSSPRLRRGRGQDSKPVASTPRPSD